ncbi:hypothetical protein AMJ47_01195 [Parcubacteria bacterium DG_72]|nr:MAG: hypothetical protein AMJ47_01195 [Parcubacteria bacterium DG_72]
MVKKVLTVVLVVMFVSPAMAEPLVRLSSGQSDPRLFTEFSFDFQFATPPVNKVKNLSESIRNVPPHGDDRWKATPGPIMKDSADAPWLMEIRFLKLGLEKDLSDSIVWKNYADLSFNYGYYFRPGADINRRNYTNHPDTEIRGYGAALTFWSPGYEQLILGFKSELHFGSEEQKDWFLGVGYRQYGLGVITGYDRYDRLDYRDFIEIGKIKEISFYLGGRTGNPGKGFFGESRIGINFNDYDKGGRYQDTNVDLADVSFFVSFGFGWMF